MNNKEIIKKTLEVLLKNATKEEHFTTIKYTINDYLREGYHIQEYIAKYNESYQKFLKGKEKRRKENDILPHDKW